MLGWRGIDVLSEDWYNTLKWAQGFARERDTRGARDNISNIFKKGMIIAVCWYSV